MFPVEGQLSCLPAVEHRPCQVAGRGEGGRQSHPPSAHAGSSHHPRSRSHPHNQPQRPAQCTAETVVRAGHCPHLFRAGCSLNPPLSPPPIPPTYLKLNGMLLRLQWDQVHAGWVGWGQEAKARQCEASSSIPLGTQVPRHPPLRSSDHVFGQAAPVLLRELPLTLLGPCESG